MPVTQPASYESSGSLATRGKRVKRNAETYRVLRLYNERFNRRDWDGLRELIAADAKLRVVDCFDGRFADSPYLSEYERWRDPWRLALGEVDGEDAIVILRLGDNGDWVPVAPISIEFADAGQDGTGLDAAGSDVGREAGGHAPLIARIVDYVHCSWVVDTAAHVRVEAA